MARRACEPHRPGRREEGKVFLLFLMPGLGSSEQNLSLLSGEAGCQPHMDVCWYLNVPCSFPLAQWSLREERNGKEPESTQCCTLKGRQLAERSLPAAVSKSEYSRGGGRRVRLAPGGLTSWSCL